MLVEADLKASELPTSSVDDVASVQKNATDVKQPEVVKIISPEPPKNEVNDQQSNIAINLVKAWARSWAAQDVDAYVSYYAVNFRPSSGLSNQQWREQRLSRSTISQIMLITLSLSV